MSAKDADDAGDAGDAVHYGHPPKNTLFLTPRGDAQKAAKNCLNKSGNPSPLIRAGPAQKYSAWSAVGRRHRAAGPIPEGRPCGPRPSAMSRTTGSGPPVADPGFSCGFGATKNSALGFGFFGFFWVKCEWPQKANLVFQGFVCIFEDTNRDCDLLGNK